MSYIVPLEIPQSCNKCPFGMCQYNKPLWADRESRAFIDGKLNKPGTYGYICNVQFEIDRVYNKILRANIGEDIPKPDWCKLKEMGCNNEP